LACNDENPLFYRNNLFPFLGLPQIYPPQEESVGNTKTFFPPEADLPPQADPQGRKGSLLCEAATQGVEESLRSTSPPSAGMV